jgi:ubiquinone/menaquinone biosynthesis C-methylase UbiE
VGGGAAESAKKSITYMHAAAEDSTLGNNDVDCVSMSLVAHELPEGASRDAFKEAYRYANPLHE